MASAQSKDPEVLVRIFQASDSARTGLISKSILLSVLNRLGVLYPQRLLDDFPNQLTEDVDYKQFLGWLCDTPTSVPMLSLEPMLVPPLKNLLLSSSKMGSNKPSLLERRQKRPRPEPNPSSTTDAPIVFESPVAEPIVIEARSITKVIGVEQTEFAEADLGSAAVLQSHIDELSANLFGLPFSMSIAIPTIPDYPVIAFSSGFTKLTGYESEDIIGKNCRFLLQGVPSADIETAPRNEARRYCRAANLRSLTTLSHTFLIQKNARKNGELFWNLFMLSIIPGPKRQSYIVGLQLDVGPELDLTPGADIAEAIKPLRRNAQIVQHIMFGGVVHRGLGDLPSDASACLADLGVRLADEVKEWIQRAEESRDRYQKWGTRPWVVWPVRSKVALLNGGGTLLRLEPDQIATGAVAMSVFPMKKKPRQCTFQLRIDTTCGRECDISKGGWLPSIAFTELNPSAMDELGGAPAVLETTAKSVCLRGDGCAFVQSSKGHDTIADMQPLASVRQMATDYVVKPGDVLECSWRAGVIEIQVDGESVSCVEDQAIPKPPNKVPVYAMVDCCHAVCKVTLLE